MLLAVAALGLLLSALTVWWLRYLWRNCTIIRWDDRPEFKTCGNCGGLGYLWRSGAKVPRSLWHVALWSMGTRRVCKPCMGRGAIITRPSKPVQVGDVVKGKVVQP